MAEASTVPGTTSLWSLIHEQRGRVGDMLSTLSDPEWETASLCTGWRVRDVAAHCLETQQMTPGRFIARFAGAGFRFDVFTARGVARHAGQAPAALLDEYRRTMNRTTSPPGPKVTWLAESIIHGEDMARPLGRSIDSSPAALALVAEFCRTSTTLLHGRARTAGLRLRATDVEWTGGDGPEVSGPAAALILATTGRREALVDLSGDGVETLRSRF